MPGALVAIAAFVLMEPVTYAAHRWLMHGPAERLHRSHHAHVARGVVPRVEANDAFPVAFAVVVLALLAVGYGVAGAPLLVPVCIGVTAYGAAYVWVHDVAIHRRWIPARRRAETPLAWSRLADAHLRHHRAGGEPYGMLWWRLGRGATAERSVERSVERSAQRPVAAPAVGAQASGSRPSHAPVEP